MLINKEHLLSQLENRPPDGWISVQAVRAMIEAEPSIDAVRHGRWITVDYEEPRRYGCSECKRLVWQLENYCPSCGADMRGEQDG